MTDTEIDALAREILTRIVEDQNIAPLFVEVLVTEGGEPIPVYGAMSQEGYGAFRCEYMPLGAIKKIISECETIFDEFTIEGTEKQTGVTLEKKISDSISAETRAVGIRVMAESAAFHMISSFKSRLRELLKEAVEDGAVVANAVVAAVVGQRLRALKIGDFTADARIDIQKAAEQSAAKRRALIADSIKRLPHVMTERGRGRTPKSDLTREREREEYAKKVEDAYRSRRLKERKPPKKMDVAGDLGEGGINPKTGSDSRTNAFNLKLERLDINYDEIARKVEDQLHNNSE